VPNDMRVFGGFLVQIVGALGKSAA